jgi:hypothetical protein
LAKGIFFEIRPLDGNGLRKVFFQVEIANIQQGRIVLRKGSYCTAAGQDQRRQL